MARSRYPESDKVLAVQKQSQACGEFLDWLKQEKLLMLCEDINGEWMPTFKSTEKLLQEFFDIDPDKLEKERRAMLDELRGAGSYTAKGVDDDGQRDQTSHSKD